MSTPKLSTNNNVRSEPVFSDREDSDKDGPEIVFSDEENEEDSDDDDGPEIIFSEEEDEQISFFYKDKKYNFITDEYIKVILSQVHPGHKISKPSLDVIRRLLNPLTKYDTGDYTDKIKVDKVLSFCKELIGELSKHAISEVEKDKRLALDGKKYSRYPVLEYLMVEILEVSGNFARNKNRVIIQPDHIKDAIKHDKELAETFSNLEN